MRPEEYGLIILRRWWLILLAVLAATVAAFVYSDSQPRTYQSSARLMAIAEPADYWLDLYAKNRLESYRDLIGNWDFVATAIQDAGLDVDPNQAIRGLTLGHNPDSNLVQIVMTDTDPERAAAVVNALADAFVARSIAKNEELAETYRQTVWGRPRGAVSIVKLETASAPEHPAGPRVRLNTAAAALLGLSFGVLLVFAAEYFDDRLRTERDVERYLNLPTVSGIPRS